MIFGYISTLHRFLFILILSLGLIIVDHRSDRLDPVRSMASIAAVPFYSAAAFPGTMYETIRSLYRERVVTDEIAVLKEENLKLKTKLQTFDELVLENNRLSRLLATSRRSDQPMIMAEIVDISMDPFRHRLIIGRGTESGVFLGQPVVVSEGVVGQISEVGIKQSVVTLITDRSHGLPVQVQRNGFRTIVRGTGEERRVSAPYVLPQADIRKGDVFVTSGMGGRFPPGYKVARVEEIIIEANRSFLTIHALTTSRLDFVKQVLLVWDGAQVLTPQ